MIDEARKAWDKLHAGLRKHGMESMAIDTLASYFATPQTRIAAADLGMGLEAETIEKLRDAAALVARAIGVTQMPDDAASALVFSRDDPGPQLSDIFSARAALRAAATSARQGENHGE